MADNLPSDLFMRALLSATFGISEEDEVEEQRAEAAIEERDRLETGADRCPPRE
jgi:hypothetical protein